MILDGRRSPSSLSPRRTAGGRTFTHACWVEEEIEGMWQGNGAVVHSLACFSRLCLAFHFIQGTWEHHFARPPLCNSSSSILLHLLPTLSSLQLYSLIVDIMLSSLELNRLIVDIVLLFIRKNIWCIIISNYAKIIVRKIIHLLWTRMAGGVVNNPEPAG